MIQPGTEAPDFELPSNLPTDDGKASGKKVKLSDFRGKNVVLAFYPLDFSPTCSQEHGCFKEDISSLESADAQVIGISVDSHWAHNAFAKQMGLKYPLVADFNPKGATAAKYGLYKDQLGFTARATVVIDKQGKVAWVKEHPLGEARNDAEILAELKKLA